ncbi:FAD-binding oxidoreductase [Streptomyces sp. MUM 203J]|uniref:FAD-binding oxidoreductase n=1 Tax=Streptomyces sp. MUM 203J TaxID=2791990 RepID=UPI001F0423EF|nr:FAD-binding oxidoreductase [Streptomyces sp. MUM 203J]MCH0543349.1 FAD-binding oxidoreductase [Streptomyces sp. MUM 203J]
MNTAVAPLDPAALHDLAEGFAGRLVEPGAGGYEEARRVWNGSVDRRPALVAYCTGVADIAAVLRCVRVTGLPLAVRSGGHSFPGLSVVDGGIVLDLSAMRGVRVDPRARTARAQAGVLLGELDRETQYFGMAVPAGIVTHTGLTGLTLGGGIGWLERAYGLTVDQLLSVDLVTADGSFVTADERREPELFWALRGGGGNFGVVTEFTFRLNPVGPAVLAGPVLWAMEDSPRVLRFYRDWITDVPDALTTIVVHRRAQPLPTIPPELHGRPVVAVISCYAGDVEEGERVLRPLREFGAPLVDLCQPKPYLRHQAMFDPSFPHGWSYYVKSCDVDRLTDEVIDTTVAHCLRMESPESSVGIFQLGGAVARVGEDDTAFGGRTAGHTFNINGNSADPGRFPAERRWARGLWEALRPHHTGVYVNFLMDEGEGRVHEAYGAGKLARLRAVKRAYDPGNLFRSNQNITPA